MRSCTLLLRNALLLASALVGAARADGLDRDTLLTDAPAVPERGTVRVTGTGLGQQKPQDGAQGTTGSISGSIQWTPVANFAGDVGAYYQAGDSGPTARVRYQILRQADFGIDLAAGVRFKTVGFHPDRGELEFLVAAGRRFGQWDLIANAVFGVETGGGGGMDLEAKAFGGYRFSESIRAGVDFRLQQEVSDQEAAPANPGRDFDLTTGPALCWQVAKNVQLQALIGAAAPKRMNNTVPVGVISAAIDF